MSKKFDPALFLAFLIPVFAATPFIQHAGIPNTADGVIHILRQVDFDGALRDGALVPRWGADLYAGFGYPLYEFAPPLLAYGIELFHLFGLAMDDALKVCIVITFELYSVGMFLFMRPKVGSHGALIAAALNTYAPLRLREALVTGGNYPQFLAMSLFPLILWSFDRLIHTRARRYLIVGTLGYAALLLSHIFHALIFTPVLIGYIVLQLLLTRASRSTWLIVCSAGALALLLSAFFWLPTIGERSLTHTAAEQYIASSDFHQRFLTWARLLAPPALLDPREANADVPLALGWAQLAVAALGIVAVGWRVQRARDWRTLLEPAFFAAVLMAAVFLQLPDSARAWESVSLLPVAEFPWRFMGLSAFALAALGGYASVKCQVSSVKKNTANSNPLLSPITRHLSSVQLVAWVILLASVISVFPYTFAPRGWVALGTPTAAMVLAYEQDTSAYGLTTINEYLPQTVKHVPTDMPAPISQAKIDLPAALIQSAQWSPHGERDMLRLAQDTRVRFHQFNYPGWQVFVDGQSAPIITADDGTLNVDVAAGEHRVETRFTSTPLRTASEGMSVVGWLVVGWLMVEPLVRRRTTQPAASIMPHDSFSRTEFVVLLALLGSLLCVKVAVLDPLGVLTAARPLQVLATFGGELELLDAQADESSITRGAALHARFYWRATQPLGNDYHVFAQLFAEDGHAVAGSDKQHPGDPVVQGESPTSQLSPDKYLRDEHRIDVPNTVSAGRYDLRVGWYDPQTGKRLKLPNGETTVRLMTIDVR